MRRNSVRFKDKHKHGLFSYTSILPHKMIKTRNGSYLRSLKNIQRRNKRKLDEGVVDQVNEIMVNKTEEPLKVEQTTITSQIQSTLDQSPHNTPIIVINQTPKIEIDPGNNIVNQNDSVINIQHHPGSNNLSVEELNRLANLSEQERLDEINNPFHVKYPLPFNPKEKYSKKIEIGTVTVNEVETLMDVINIISSIYFDFYSSLPEQDTMKKGTLEKTIGILKYYAKIRTFLSTVFHKRDELVKNINFLEGKIHLFRTDVEDMLRFYNLQEKYFHVRIMNMSFISNSDFNSYQKDIEDINREYNKDITHLLHFAYELGKQSADFIEEINDLQRNEYNHSIMNVLEKFDKVIMITIRLLETKINIETTIESLQVSLRNLKKYRYSLNETILNMEKIAKPQSKIVEKPHKEKLSSFYWIMRPEIFLVLITILI